MEKDDKMYCEECQSVMHWRCTNQITQVSKFKCPQCGHVQTGILETKPVVSVEKPNYYHMKNGKWLVKKTKDHQMLYVGTYANEETAQKVVSEMIKCDWNLDMIPEIYEKLNIHKVNRSWVCT